MPALISSFVRSPNQSASQKDYDDLDRSAKFGVPSEKSESSVHNLRVEAHLIGQTSKIQSIGLRKSTGILPLAALHGTLLLARPMDLLQCPVLQRVIGIVP